MDTKPTNPKDMIGADKLPLHLFPTTAVAHGCIALLDGMLKYGRHNWRAVGVRPSIYYDAIRRHLDAWMEGEDNAPDSEIPHLAHALAGIAILIDSTVKDNLHDDRYYPQNYREMVEELTPHVARLKAEHADKDPYHYTIDRRGDGDRDLNQPQPEGWEPSGDMSFCETSSKRQEIRQRIIDKYNAPAASIVRGLKDAVKLTQQDALRYIREDLYGSVEVTQELVDDYNSYAGGEPLVTWEDDDGGDFIDPDWENDDGGFIVPEHFAREVELEARIEQLELDKAALLEGAKIRSKDLDKVERIADKLSEEKYELNDQLDLLKQEHAVGVEAQRRALREMQVELENSDVGILRLAFKAQADRIKELEEEARKADHSAYCECSLCDW